MPLNKFFPFTLNARQYLAARELTDFFDNDTNVFMLTGYAGTGKTSLLKGIIAYLVHHKRSFRLLASTGRAAMVLHNKTGHEANTVHSAIYKLSESVLNEKEGTHKLKFVLRENTDLNNTIYFVDEASMIADKNEINKNLQFDDGRFLKHFFDFIEHRKVVFVGDTAQLLPVNCGFSPTLIPNYLQDVYHKTVFKIELSQVMRQIEESGILNNATRLRQHIANPPVPQLIIATSPFKDFNVTRNTWASVDAYIRDMQQHGCENQIMIAFSNGAVHFLNQYIREKLYHVKNAPLQADDWMLIYQNNRLHELHNGQHVKIEQVYSITRKIDNLVLQKVKLWIPSEKRSIETFILADFPFALGTSLNVEDEISLIKDFNIRMHKQNIKKEDPLFLQMLQNDPFLNALRIKFGYALTCHKAQGGEWNTVYIHSEPAFEKSPHEFQYRWLYTALTRAQQRCVISQNQFII